MTRIIFSRYTMLPLVFGLLATPWPASADWPSFRGPNGTRIVADGKLPDRLEPTKILWQHDLQTRDVGSPISWKDRIYLLRSRPSGDAISLDCLSLTTGEEIWSTPFPQSNYHLHRRNTLASGTPAADENHIYASWSDGEHTMLVAVSHDGNEVWQRDFGRFQSQHGYGASPLVVGENVVLFCSQQAEQLDPGQEPGVSRMISVNRDSGETDWASPLTTTRACYGTPAIIRDASGNPDLLVGANTGDGLFGIDASSGKMLFHSKVFSKRCCSSPIVFGDLLIGTCGSGGGGNEMVAVRIPTSGSAAEEVYRITSGAPYVPTSVIKDGLLFAVDDRGIASCFDASTGKTLKKKRLGGNFGASPIIVGDQWLVIDLKGNATILSADEQIETLWQGELGGPVGATPIHDDGRLLVRVDDKLICYSDATD